MRVDLICGTNEECGRSKLKMIANIMEGTTMIGKIIPVSKSMTAMTSNRQK
jgi:hypothetical protein